MDSVPYGYKKEFPLMIFNEEPLCFLKILKAFQFYLKGQTLFWFRSRTQKLVSLFLVLERLLINSTSELNSLPTAWFVIWLIFILSGLQNEQF